MKNQFGLKFRFIERDYLYNKMKSESTYISDEHINMILDEQPNLQDVTLIFYPHKSGFITNFYCNNSESKISQEDLGLAAFDFFIKQVEYVSTLQYKAREAVKDELKLEQRVNDNIRQIRDILYKWDGERKGSNLQAVR